MPFQDERHERAMAYVQTISTKRVRHIVGGFLLSYALFLLIALSLGVITYAYSQDIIQRELIRSNQLILENTMNLVDQSMDFIATKVFDISQGGVIARLMHRNEGLSGNEIILLSYLKDELPTLSDEGGLVDGYYIYSLFNDFIIAPGKGYLNISQYYDSDFRFGSLTFPEWKSEILSEPYYKFLFTVNDIMWKGSLERRIAYIHSYQLPDTGVIAGQVVILISDAAISRMMSPALDNGASFIFISDQSGKIITTVSIDISAATLVYDELLEAPGILQKSIAGEETIITRCTSSTSGWTYIAGFRKQLIVERAASILQIIIVFTVALLALGVILSIVLANYNSKPLRRLVSTLDLPSEHGIGFRGSMIQVGSAVENLIDNTRTLESKMKKQQENLQQALIARLVSGDVHEEAELDELMNQIGSRIDPIAFRGVYLDMNYELQPDTEKGARGYLNPSIVAAILASWKEHIPLIHLISQNRFALLLISRTDNDETTSIASLFEAIHSELLEKYDIESTFYIGRSSASLAETSKSFPVARKMLDLGLNSQGSFIVFDDELPDIRQGYIYSIGDESRLLNIVTAGDVVGVRKLLDEIRNRNLAERKLPVSSIQLLLYRLIGTLMEAGTNPRYSEILAKVNEQSAEATFNTIITEFERLCTEVSINKKNHHARLIQEIETYLRNNYSNVDLSLSFAALRYRFNESYFSVLFKESFGVNFSEYLEHLRIQRADELLAAKEGTIGEISLKVGYASPHSFRRAYKRVKGCSPSLMNPVDSSSDPNL
jgi:two-component system response regulator YesN